MLPKHLQIDISDRFFGRGTKTRDTHTHKRDKGTHIQTQLFYYLELRGRELNPGSRERLLITAASY